MREVWEIRKLGDICTSFSGYTPSGELLHEMGAYPYFKVAEMNRPDNLKVMRSTDAYVDNPTRVYRKGAIVFPKNGASVATNKKRILGQDSVVDLNTGGFLADEKLITPFFFYYLMQHIDFKQYVRRGTVPTLDIKELKEKECRIPPILEQEKIVAELDCLTGIIEKKKQQLEVLDKLAQSIFYDMFGDPITNEKGWAIGSFGKIMTIAKVERCGEREGLPVLSITMRNGIVRQSERFKKVIASKDVSAYKVVPRGCLVIAFPIDEGLIYIQDVDDEGIMSPAYNVWDVNYAKVQKDFLVAYFHSAFAMKYYKDKLRGTTQRRRMLAKEDLLSMPIPLPPMAVQNLFAQKLEAIEKQKELIKQSLTETETLFNSRMDYWFN